MSDGVSLDRKSWVTRVLVAFGLMAVLGCASGVLQYEEVEKLEINEEYDKMIKVKEIAPAAASADGLKPGPEEAKPPEKKKKARW